MKFEVIGWTNGEDERYPDHVMEYGCVERAVIGAIREGGYSFDGFDHQYNPAGTPVLNDGTKATFGMRAWGSLMAEAHNAPDGDGLAYMQWYVDEEDLMGLAEGKPSRAVLPPAKVDRSRILPRKALAEEFEMHLSPAAFEAVLSGKKTADIRLNDEKRRLVCKGDRILFLCGDRRCPVRVTKTETFRNLEQLFRKERNDWDGEQELSRRRAIVRRAFFGGCDTSEALYRSLTEIYGGSEKLLNLRKAYYDEAIFIAFKREQA